LSLVEFGNSMFDLQAPEMKLNFLTKKQMLTTHSLPGHLDDNWLNNYIIIIILVVQLRSQLSSFIWKSDKNVC